MSRPSHTLIRPSTLLSPEQDRPGRDAAAAVRRRHHRSLVSVQPLDQAGNPTPAWWLKVHVALVAVALTTLPTALVLVTGGGWLAVPAGVATGTVSAAWLGRLAVTRLADRQVAILRTLAAAP